MTDSILARIADTLASTGRQLRTSDDKDLDREGMIYTTIAQHIRAASAEKEEVPGVWTEEDADRAHARSRNERLAKAQTSSDDLVGRLETLWDDYGAEKAGNDHGYVCISAEHQWPLIKQAITRLRALEQPAKNFDETTTAQIIAALQHSSAAKSDLIEKLSRQVETLERERSEANDRRDAAIARREAVIDTLEAEIDRKTLAFNDVASDLVKAREALEHIRDMTGTDPGMWTNSEINVHNRALSALTPASGEKQG